MKSCILAAPWMLCAVHGRRWADPPRSLWSMTDQPTEPLRSLSAGVHGWSESIIDRLRPCATLGRGSHLVIACSSSTRIRWQAQWPFGLVYPPWRAGPQGEDADSLLTGTRPSGLACSGQRSRRPAVNSASWEDAFCSVAEMPSNWPADFRKTSTRPRKLCSCEGCANTALSCFPPFQFTRPGESSAGSRVCVRWRFWPDWCSWGQGRFRVVRAPACGTETATPGCVFRKSELAKGQVRHGRRGHPCVPVCSDRPHYA